MRDYLIKFFRDFEYEERDAKTLLATFDTINKKEDAKKLLFDALSVYEANHKIDYAEEIIGRAKKITELTDTHPYTVEFLLFVCMTKRLKVLYEEKDLDMQIYRDCVLDLKWKLNECKEVRGICGSFVALWFSGFFNLERFALGRLQFELTKARADYQKDGVTLKKGESIVINVHIPRTGTPMDKESCDRSYAMAREFFKNATGNDYVFVCHSWLLFPQNKEILPSHTNVYRFMSEYDIVDWGYNEGNDLWRLFDTQEMNPDRLPTNGSLRRAYVEHLKKGKRVGWGYGVKK